MVTDGDRRRVAENLRNGTPITSYRQSQGGGWAHLRDMAVAVGFKREDAPTAWELAQRLADLIDRPTCQMVECTVDHGYRSWGMRCTACGKEFEHVKPGFGWRYCPNCGAVVAGD